MFFHKVDKNYMLYSKKVSQIKIHDSHHYYKWVIDIKRAFVSQVYNSTNTNLPLQFFRRRSKFPCHHSPPPTEPMIGPVVPCAPRGLKSSSLLFCALPQPHLDLSLSGVSTAEWILHLTPFTSYLNFLSPVQSSGVLHYAGGGAANVAGFLEEWKEFWVLFFCLIFFVELKQCNGLPCLVLLL